MATLELSKNRNAFLDMIAWSEIGPALLKKSDNGYNVVVGGSLFEGYLDHPNIRVNLKNGLWSTAAGRYQLLHRYFEPYRKLLGLHDFGPESQDRIALQQIRECKALQDIDEGRIEAAVRKCARIWASLPGAGYGQHENAMAKCLDAYVAAGGTFSKQEG